MRAVEVAAYRVSTLEAPRSWLVHAVNGAEAREIVGRGFQEPVVLVANRADELDILPTFSDDELLRLVATVWRNPDPVRPVEKKASVRYRRSSETTTSRRYGHEKLRRSEMYYRVAPLYRLYWVGDRTRKMLEHHRLLAIYAIRIAMLVPGFGPAVELPQHVPPTSAHRIHSANVSAKVIRLCERHGLDLFDPFTAPQRAALVTLATEYGYDAASMNDLGAARAVAARPSMSDPLDIESLLEPDDDASTPSQLDSHRARLDAICDADIRLLFANGAILPPEQWPDREALAIERFTANTKNDESVVTQITLLDRSRALESAARLDQLYKPKKAEAVHPLVALLMRVPRADLRQVIRYLDMLGARAND